MPSWYTGCMLLLNSSHFAMRAYIDWNHKTYLYHIHLVSITYISVYNPVITAWLAYICELLFLWYWYMHTSVEKFLFSAVSDTCRSGKFNLYLNTAINRITCSVHRLLIGIQTSNRDCWHLKANQIHTTVLQ